MVLAGVLWIIYFIYNIYFSLQAHIKSKVISEKSSKALELAELYGWQPRRTQPPAHIDFYALGAEWHGGYLTNDGQSVIASDAR